MCIHLCHDVNVYDDYMRGYSDMSTIFFYGYTSIDIHIVRTQQSLHTYIVYIYGYYCLDIYICESNKPHSFIHKEGACGGK